MKVKVLKSTSNELKIEAPEKAGPVSPMQKKKGKDKIE